MLVYDKGNFILIASFCTCPAAVVVENGFVLGGCPAYPLRITANANDVS